MNISSCPSCPTSVSGVVWLTPRFAIVKKPVHNSNRITSYGFYIYHFPILWILNDSIFQYIGHSFILGHLVSMFLCGGLILGISLISWYCLERPILRLKTYFPSNRDDKLSLIETGNLK